MYVEFLILEERNTVVQGFFVMLVIRYYVDVCEFMYVWYLSICGFA